MLKADHIADFFLTKRGDCTHLKLQKLVFYGVGALLGAGHVDEVREIHFEAWDHGPVSRPLFERFRKFGREPLPAPSSSPSFNDSIGSVLNDADAVYGLLSAWQLREQSHLEEPWLRARELGTRQIPQEALRVHFQDRHRDPVEAPEYLVGATSLRLDGLSVPVFESFADLARFARTIPPSLA